MTASDTSDYREYRAPPALADRIVCFWLQNTFGTGTYLQTVLPDGCMDIVWIGESAPMLVGPATRTLIAELPAGTLIVGVRFLPGCAPVALGGLDAGEIVNRQIPLGDIWRSGADALTGRLLESKGTAATLDALATGTGTLLADGPCVDPLVRYCTGWIARNVAGRVGELATAVGLSERQPRRRFRSQVGYAPKTFQRIMRLQRLLAFSGRAGDTGTDLAALALDAGYSDQAHMCREVRSLAVTSPRALLERGAGYAMADLFNTTDRDGSYPAQP